MYIKIRMSPSYQHSLCVGYKLPLTHIINMHAHVQYA